MQYVPTEVPLVCWLVDSGCWRWFTVLFVVLYYDRWRIAEHRTSRPTFQKGFTTWRSHHTVSFVPLPFTWLLTWSRRPVRITCYWHLEMFTRAVAFALIACTFEYGANSWDYLLFTPVLKVCLYFASLSLSMVGYVFKLFALVVRVAWWTAQVTGYMPKGLWYLLASVWHFVLYLTPSVHHLVNWPPTNFLLWLLGLILEYYLHFMHFCTLVYAHLPD